MKFRVQYTSVEYDSSSQIKYSLSSESVFLLNWLIVASRDDSSGRRLLIRNFNSRTLTVHRAFKFACLQLHLVCVCVCALYSTTLKVLTPHLQSSWKPVRLTPALRVAFRQHSITVHNHCIRQINESTPARDSGVSLFITGLHLQPSYNKACQTKAKKPAANAIKVLQRFFGWVREEHSCALIETLNLAFVKQNTKKKKVDFSNQTGLNTGKEWRLQPKLPFLSQISQNHIKIWW